jgi:hypothetical protein
MGFKSSLDWPEGNWQKGSTTTLLMESRQSLLKPFFVFTARCSVAFFGGTKEWMEEYLTDDRVTEWNQTDSRVTFIAVAT